jgi:hypothetical protein
MAWRSAATRHATARWCFACQEGLTGLIFHLKDNAIGVALLELKREVAIAYVSHKRLRGGCRVPPERASADHYAVGINGQRQPCGLFKLMSTILRNDNSLPFTRKLVQLRQAKLQQTEVYCWISLGCLWPLL